MDDHREQPRAKWCNLISEQQQSGKSIAGFCRERGLRAWQFYEWKKRLNLRGIHSGAHRSEAGVLRLACYGLARIMCFLEDPFLANAVLHKPGEPSNSHRADVITPSCVPIRKRSRLRLIAQICKFTR
jgi:hypothetical protein